MDVVREQVLTFFFFSLTENEDNCDLCVIVCH